MKIRLDEHIVTLGNYQIVRIDDYNLELQDKNGDMLGYYGFMCHAVREAFKRTMNDVRELGVFDNVLGDAEQEAEMSDQLFNAVPVNAIYDFIAEAKKDKDDGGRVNQAEVDTTFNYDD